MSHELPRRTCRISEEVKDGVSDGVDYRREGGDTGDMSVEEVEGREVPASRPDEDVVPPTEHPEPGQVCVGQDSCPVREVAPDLDSRVVPAMPRLSECCLRGEGTRQSLGSVSGGR